MTVLTDPRQPPLDGVLVVGFGGPARPDDAEEFVRSVLGAGRADPDRVSEVVSHYRRVGGSPYVARATDLAGELRQRLVQAGIDLDVELGFCHSAPPVTAALAALAARGRRRVAVVVLAAFPCWATDTRYDAVLAEAVRTVPDPPALERIGPWFEHERFVQAQAEAVHAATRSLPGASGSSPWLLFTAHALPDSACRRCPLARPACPYAAAVRRVSSAIASRVQVASWLTAYQSLPPAVVGPHTRPLLAEALAAARNQGARTLVACPVGFAVENVEITFDLDVELAELAAAAGLAFARSSSVSGHPAFVAALVEAVTALPRP